MNRVTTPYFCAQTNHSDQITIKRDNLYLLGFEFDGTACFRKGAKDGPNAIRDVSDGIESYSPYLNKDLTDITFFDLGNLPTNEGESWEMANQHFSELFASYHLCQDNIKILTLGGEHSIPYIIIKKYLNDFTDLQLLHLDAHADLRDGYENHYYSHASIIRRVLDHFGRDHSLLQFGIRSGTKEEFRWMQEKQTLVTSITTLLERIDPKRPIYLTLDVDFFDPAFMPGTGTPEAGGENFATFITLIKYLRQMNLVGADIVELAPNLDPTGNSSVFAATLVRELLLAMS